MSKDLVHPSLIRAGIVELEMAEETTDLINRTIESNQAHLQGEPFYVDSLPEDMSKLRIEDQSGRTKTEEGEGDEDSSEEDDYLFEGQDPLILFQNFLDEIGAKAVKKLKTGEGFFRVWSALSDDIKGYVSTHIMTHRAKNTKSIQIQTEPAASSSPGGAVLQDSRSKDDPNDKKDHTADHDVVSDVESAIDKDESRDIEGEVAHQVAESFSKKYKFPSRSSGIFLWNFEQLKMNLDDIVKAAMNVPGVEKIAEKGGKLPLRCILGFVALDSSKRFRLLANNDKVARLIQDDINSYMARLEEAE
uniref:Phosphoprotein n=2 Tax=Mokola virus TaxID=12538 RepID=Q91RE1_MOKV|nr:phosphoprotein [Lyssavirus mokola]ACV86808.1 phosphoprotein [Lyssavirus mokola]AGQ16864.1 phosphoprotein [Lyssavirus mokola]